MSDNNIEKRGMAPEDRFWLWFWGLVVGAIAIIVLAICITYHRSQRMMLEAGYEEVIVPSMYTMVWQKRDPAQPIDREGKGEVK